MHHFKRIPISFEAGLWTASEGLRPPNSAAELIDCYPQRGGGLAAFGKFEETLDGGISADERPIGFFSRGGIGMRSGASTSASDHYLMTFDESDTRPRLYRWDQSDDVTPPVAWELIKTFAVSNATFPHHSIFALYTIGGTVHVYAVGGTSVGGDAGLYRINYADGVVTLIHSQVGIDALCLHQDRFVIGTTQADQSRIKWNDPGTETFDALSFWDVLPYYNLPDTQWLRPHHNDLIIAKSGAPFVFMQGDIEDPIFRVFSEAKYAPRPTVPTETPDGLVWCIRGEGAYLTNTGAEHQYISKQLHPDDIAPAFDDSVSQGWQTFAGRWVFFPTGVILDLDTNAYFRTSGFGIASALGAGKFQHHDRLTQYLYVATAGSGFKIKRLPTEEPDWDHASSYTAQTGKIHDESGRRIVVREVAMVFDSYSAGSDIEVYVNGNQRDALNIGSGRQAVRVPFEIEDEAFDVKIVAKDAGTGRAPSLEQMYVDTLEGRLVA